MNGTELALAIARRWLRAYTYGLPRPIAVARRQEIESDLFEQSQLEGDSVAGAFSILARTALGMPHDLSWRFAPRASSRLRFAIVERCLDGGCDVNTAEGTQQTVAYSELMLSRIKVRPGELVAVTGASDEGRAEVVWRLFRGRIHTIGKDAVCVQQIDSAGEDMRRSAEIPVSRIVGGSGGYASGDRGVFFGDEGSGETHLLGRADGELGRLQQQLVSRLPVTEASLRLLTPDHG